MYWWLPLTNGGDLSLQTAGRDVMLFERLLESPCTILVGSLNRVRLLKDLFALQSFKLRVVLFTGHVMWIRSSSISLRTALLESTCRQSELSSFKRGGMKGGRRLDSNTFTSVLTFEMSLIESWIVGWIWVSAIFLDKYSSNLCYWYCISLMIYCKWLVNFVRYLKWKYIKFLFVACMP